MPIALGLAKSVRVPADLSLRDFLPPFAARPLGSSDDGGTLARVNKMERQCRTAAAAAVAALEPLEPSAGLGWRPWRRQLPSKREYRRLRVQAFAALERPFVEAQGPRANGGAAVRPLLGGSRSVSCVAET